MKTNITIELCPEELKTLIRDAVREELSKIQNQGSPEEKYISRKEAKEILNVSSDTTMISFEKRGLITPRRTGKKIIYLEAEIRSALQKFGR
ncbi:MAG: hypothetical protein A2Y71_03075 [Bacteroidetes bacterium RBG_13_42_15]|nr:MAG: hypothetical protein A2Y71_03075 [Bacteroidetes bacterium RBG_13_42_15]